MSEAPDAERERSPYIRLPLPVVAFGLLAFLALVLAAGLFANRNLRPQIGVAPTLSAVALGTATPIPGAAPATSQANAPTSVATQVVLFQVPTATPTIPPPFLTSNPALDPAATASPTERPTVEPALADDVGKAYLTFWRVRSQALLELDGSHLAEVMDGDYLDNIAELVDQLRSEGRAIKTQVVLNYSVLEATKEAATVVDYVEDNSIYVKIGTEDPITSPTADQLRITYRLRRFPEAWKVVDSVRSE